MIVLSYCFRTLPVTLLLVLAWMAVGETEIIRQVVRPDGRLYFTNLSDGVRPDRQPMASPTPVSTSAPAPPQVLSLMHRLAAQHQIDPHLLQAIITVESNFNPYAVSHAGAQGLMQLMPGTAARYQVNDPFNPEANLQGGIRYLKDLFALFSGDLQRVLAAYNAGEGAVSKYGGMPPYPETQRYVARVLTLYGSPSTRQIIYRYHTVTGSVLFTDTPRER